MANIFEKLWDNATDSVSGAVGSVYDSTIGAVGDAYDSATDAVSDWWNDTEDNEPAPKTYVQQEQTARLAEGSAIPVVKTATTNTGETVVVKQPSAIEQYQPYLIGGGVLVVVLLVFALMMRGGR